MDRLRLRHRWLPERIRPVLSRAESHRVFCSRLSAKSSTCICDRAGCRQTPTPMPLSSDPVGMRPHLCQATQRDFFCGLHDRATGDGARISYAGAASARLLQDSAVCEGLGRQLYPQLDLWETAEPFMRRWAVRHLGAVAVITKLLNQGPRLWSELHRLPSLLDDTQTIDLRKQLANQQQELQALSDSCSKCSGAAERRRWWLGIAAGAAGAF